MNKKKWALLVLCAALLFGYFKLFYKTYSETVIAKNADAIIAIDVKRVTNTLIWNFITTPGLWKIRSHSSNKKEEVNWKDMIAIPDYVLAFHIKDQPVNTWYVVLQIKDEKDFEKGLLQYHFEKLNTNQYVSNTVGLQLYKNGNQILVSTAAAENANEVAAIADELFVKKLHITKETLVKVINAKSHLAVYLAANNFLQQDGIITANFNKQKIEINSIVIPNKQFSFTENNFVYSSKSLFTLCFTQPSQPVYHLLSDSTKSSISKALGFSMDSLLLPANKYYALDIEAIKQRVDSAVTYSYDDDFNKVEKRVVNNVQEPAFNFFGSGDSAKQFYTYCLGNNKIDKTDSRQIFTAIPFVKSYFDTMVNKGINITAANYVFPKTNSEFAGILFLHLLVSEIPDNLLKYFPDDFKKILSNIESIQLEINRNNEQLVINFLMLKKNNDLPIIKL